MMLPVFCTALLLACSMTVLMGHRLTVEREQAWPASWARLQAQALGHGGLMWALARLEDPRKIDGQCRTLPGGVLSFADLAVGPDARISCTVANLDAEVPMSWTCRCGTAGAQTLPDASPGLTPGLIEWTFQPAGELLDLTVRSKVASMAMAGPTFWKEQVRLRRDAQGVWRLVVGSWKDERD